MQSDLAKTRDLWDEAAATFDLEPDHGLRSPTIRTAWTKLLRESLPKPPQAILDVGCGTGSLSEILIEQGYHVMGIDISPKMISLAKQKLKITGQSANLKVMDAAYPEFEQASFDVILSRHVLWSFADYDHVLRRWIHLLKPGGRLLLVEGFWYTGAGLHSGDIARSLKDCGGKVNMQSLSEESILWGGTVTDERYLMIFEIT